MLFVQDDAVVETLAPDTAQEPLAQGVGAGLEGIGAKTASSRDQ